MTGLEPLPEAAPDTLDRTEILDRLADEMTANIANCRALSTWKAYASDWRHFTAWCETLDLEPMPAVPRTVALYISDLARDDRDDGPMSPSTIGRRLAAIQAAHDHHGEPSPTDHVDVRKTRTGIARRLGTAPRNQKRAIST